MNTLEEISEKNSGVLTAGIYISCDKTAFEPEKLISEKLDLILVFAEAHDIIIVDSYIDRSMNSKENYDRLVKDCKEHIFDLVLCCTNTLSGLENVVVIDVASQN